LEKDPEWIFHWIETLLEKDRPMLA